MRAVKAKRLRREVYGDYSLRDRKWFLLPNGTLVSDTRRRAYQDAKRRAG